ncbi:MAG: ABC transporter permease [Actinobacteria bacterium]|nr:ABC transporter permease [Actinomycetota bacterium]
MRKLKVLLHLTKFGIKGLMRNQRALVFTIAFPIILLVLFNSIFAHGKDTTTLSHGTLLDENAYFTAGILAYSIMLSAFSTMAIGLVAQRESGQLKRLRGTPLPPWVFMVAQVLRAILLILFMTVALLLIGHFAYGVHFPGDTFGGFILYLVVGTATMCILGIALTALTPTAESASTIAPFSAVLLSFISGVFIPVSELPGWLQEIGRVFPLARLADGLQTTLAPATTGSGLSGTNLGVMGLWALGGLIVAVRKFSWEPQAVRA